MARNPEEIVRHILGGTGKNKHEKKEDIVEEVMEHTLGKEKTEAYHYKKGKIME